MLVGTVVLALAAFAAATFDPELHAKYLQLPREEFIQYFNKQNYSWKITHYPHLEDRQHLCGTLLNNTRRSDIEIRHHDPAAFASLPQNFDSREKWSNCQTINDVFNQGQCNSCWAVATATVASDRTCIGTGANVRLSPQDFDCLQTVCEGGVPDRSFPFWQNSGLVSRDCKPYDIYDRRSCVQECKDPSMNYQNDKHYAENVYSVPADNEQIKTELFMNGPIFAGFQAYEDLDHYNGGIYVHKYGVHKGGHGVRVIGYGEENGVEFWLVANSWGPTWGEQGFFRIKKYQPELQFEQMNYAGTPRN